MSQTTNTGSALAGADPGSSRKCLAAFLAWLQQSGLPASRIRSTYGAGRHFLTWLRAAGIGLDGIDDDVLRRFRRHDCRCVHAQGGHYKRSARRSRQYMARVAELVRFLEQTGRTAHPGELEQGIRLAEDFVERCAREGFADRTLRWYRSACRHFLTWLHGTRLPMAEMAAAPVLPAFLAHDCLCPGGFRSLSPPRPGATRYAVPIEAFTRFLAMRGRDSGQADPARGRFRPGTGGVSALAPPEPRHLLQHDQGVSPDRVRVPAGLRQRPGPVRRGPGAGCPAASLRRG